MYSKAKFNSHSFLYFILGYKAENLSAIIAQKSKDDLVSVLLEVLNDLHYNCN